MKSPEDKHKLIPDENAPTVQRMFQMALEGMSCSAIATTLKSEKVPTPGAYIRGKDGVLRENKRVKYPYSWFQTTVKDILSNEVYIGNMVNLRYTSKSFKDKRLVERPQSEWIRVENTHEPLVGKDTFYTVQKRISVKKPQRMPNPDNIFRGLLICGECGKRIVYKKENSAGKTAKYKCNLYLKRGSAYCTSHSINASDLYAIVLDDINRHIRLSNKDKDSYIDSLIRQSDSKLNGEKSSLQRELQRIKQRLDELNVILQNLYEDKVFKRISEERYAAVSANLEKEEKQLKERYSEIQSGMTRFAQQSKSAREFADLIEQYSPITELDAALLNTLIEKIVIHENIGEDGSKEMSIEIYYRFIGKAGEYAA